MPEIYEEFIVYIIENTGDRTRLDITPEELQYHLNPKQVLIIICDDLRRIFIWKGAKSPVRKRFISSRVAQDLQRDLIQDSRYHKCKIISIDQGDELQEFLNAFRLESMEVTERLPDVRYIRNVERDRLLELESYRDQITKQKIVQSSKKGKKEKRPRLTDEEIMILVLESEKSIKLIDQYKDFFWGKRKRRGSGDDRYPYPYVFKPPESPDDLALAPRVQLHASPKKKDPEEKIICQFCGRELTKEEQFTHSCKKKPE